MLNVYINALPNIQVDVRVVCNSASLNSWQVTLARSTWEKLFRPCQARSCSMA